jgi:Type II CAAX prenyl endopeptidase Rce1-like
MEQAGAHSPVKSSSVSARSRRRNWIEIAVAYGLIMSVVWAPRPWQRFLWIVAAASVVFITWISFDGWKTMGFRTANLGRSLWIAGAALAIAGVAIFLAARLNTLLLPNGLPAFVETYCAYAIWTGVQQFLLQSFFLLRFLRVIPDAAIAALTAAALFASAHLPNPVLAPITLIWGFVACLLFLHYRNIYPLMIAHAILGITVAMTIPGPADHNMRVGLGYLTYGAHHHPHHHTESSQP